MIGANTHRNSSSPLGFTLLELLISLTIVGVVLVIIFGALRIGARAWEKGEADVEIQQRERVVLAMVKRQISSFCDREIEPQDKDPYLFKGDERSMAFMSRLPAVPGARSGMVYVKYVINSTDEGRNDLVFYEQDVVSTGVEGVLEYPDGTEFQLLIPGVYHISFDYLKRPEEGNVSPEWQGVWDPESDEGFPMAVRMTFQRDENEMPIRVIAPIHPEKTDNRNR